MKIHIAYEINEKPYGGGNQFLSALKHEWESRSVHEADPSCADAVLFNSFEHIDTVLHLKKKYPTKLFVHRVDGPIYLVRGKDKVLDQEIFLINNILADATIFQSSWSQKKLREMGMKKSVHESIIYNAPDSRFFARKQKQKLDPSKKTRLIAVSWSDNWNKGFHDYAFLDTHLDFSKYEMSFIGRSPIKFKNIKMHGPQKSHEIAKQLRSSDIYVTASRTEPCSNSLIEALASGLPAVAHNSGGHPELIKNGGELYIDNQDLLEKIEKVSHNYLYYVDRLPTFSMANTADEYYMFMTAVATQRPAMVKRLSFFDLLRIRNKQLHVGINNFRSRLFSWNS